MPKGYHHLTYDQRCQIYILKARGDASSSIATILKVHHSTSVGSLREIKGNEDTVISKPKKKHFLEKILSPIKK